MEFFARSTATIGVWASTTFISWIVSQGPNGSPLLLFGLVIAALGSTYIIWSGANNYAEEEDEEEDEDSDDDDDEGCDCDICGEDTDTKLLT